MGVERDVLCHARNLHFATARAGAQKSAREKSYLSRAPQSITSRIYSYASRAGARRLPRWRHTIPARPTKPRPIIAQVAGSGVVRPATELTPVRNPIGGRFAVVPSLPQARKLK